MEALVVSATEASKMLRTSPNEIYKKLESGEIPAYKDGPNNNSWKIPKALLIKYVEAKALEEAKDRSFLHDEVYKEEVKDGEQEAIQGSRNGGADSSGLSRDTKLR